LRYFVLKQKFFGLMKNLLVLFTADLKLRFYSCGISQVPQATETLTKLITIEGAKLKKKIKPLT